MKSSARELHLRWRYIALVAVGGAFGTAARYLLTLSIPAWPVPLLAGVDLTTLVINVVGAFALGVVLEALARSGNDIGARRTLRLLIGTGFLGGFTTYSALALNTNVLFASGRPWIAVAYAAATLLFGAGASTAGILASSRHHRARHPGNRDGIEL